MVLRDAFAWIADYVAEHEDLERSGLVETPNRVVRAYQYLLQGYETDPAELLKTFSEPYENGQLVSVDNIPFVSLCEHHVLPFWGFATVGYVPCKRIVGLSKIARLVDAYARRLQVQERLTRQIAQTLMTALESDGVGVVIKAQHMCMMARGVQKTGAWTTTSYMLGCFLTDSGMRDQLLSAAGRTAV